MTDVVYPGSKSNTAYGIWYNGGTSYTRIVGGATGFPVQSSYALAGDASVSTGGGNLFVGGSQGIYTSALIIRAWHDHLSIW